MRSELTQEIYKLQNKYGETEPHKPVPGDERSRKRRPKGKTKIQKVVEFKDLKAKVTMRPDPSVKALTVGAKVMPASDGVIIAQGGGAMGYSLYINKGKPVFATRVAGKLVEVVGKEKLDPKKQVHLVGVISNRGQAILWADGRRGRPDGFHAGPTE